MRFDVPHDPLVMVDCVNNKIALIVVIRGRRVSCEKPVSSLTFILNVPDFS